MWHQVSIHAIDNCWHKAAHVIHVMLQVRSILISLRPANPKQTHIECFAGMLQCGELARAGAAHSGASSVTLGWNAVENYQKWWRKHSDAVQEEQKPGLGG